MKPTSVRYGMLALVFVNVAINYLDRANIAVAATTMRGDLGLSTVQMGYIFSAFGWAYAALQIPGGLIADRYGPRVLYAFCLITWSLTTMAQALVRGFAGLFALRMATGTFEAPSYPINNRVVTSWFPDHERASAIAFYVCGQFIGLAFLTPVLATLQQQVGWQGLFVCTGVVGIVWGLVWYALYRDPLASSKANQAELDYIEAGGGLFQPKAEADKIRVWQWVNLKQVLTGRTLWGVYIGQFAVNATLWFFLTWFPTYLATYRGLGYVKSGYLSSIPYLAACVGLILSGTLSDRLVRRGMAVGRARRMPIIFGLLLSVSIVGANYTDDTFLIIFFMSLAFFGAGMALISWVFVSILSPKNLIGLTGGVFNFMGNLASIVVPIVIGYLAKDGNFEPALIFIGVVEFIGACAYLFMVGNLSPASTNAAKKLTINE